MQTPDANIRHRAEVRLAKRRQRLERTLREKRRLKWLHLLLALAPLGLVWAWWVAAWVAFAWLTFWGVGAYMNYFHVRDAAARLEEAERELQELSRA